VCAEAATTRRYRLRPKCRKMCFKRLRPMIYRRRSRLIIAAESRLPIRTHYTFVLDCILPTYVYRECANASKYNTTSARTYYNIKCFLLCIAHKHLYASNDKIYHFIPPIWRRLPHCTGRYTDRGTRLHRRYFYDI